MACAACGNTTRPAPPGLIGYVPTGDGGQQQPYVPPHDAGIADTQGAPDDAGIDVTAADGGGPDVSADAVAADDVAVEAPAPIVCNTVVPMGPQVAETLLTTGVPSATGGTIATGTYWLTELDLYGAGPDASSATATRPPTQRTLVVDTTMMTVMFAEAVSADDGGVASTDSSSSSYAISDTIVSLSETCPASGSANNIHFTVQGSELWLFPTSSQREVYSLQ
jgi:hypothetical protein